MSGPGYVPSVLGDSIELWLGTPATGRATAGSTTVDLVEFTQLRGQPAAVQFTAADVGAVIAIIGGGPVNPLMPPTWFVQGSLFHSTITAINSPTSCEIADAPDTYIYNSGFCTVIVYRDCPMKLDSFNYQSSIAPGTRDTFDFVVEAKFNRYIDRFTSIAMGQPVYVRSSDAAVGDIFGGEIDTVVINNQLGYEGMFSWSCHCASWGSIAGRRVVAPAIPQTLSGPGDEVFAKVVLDYLNDEGVAVDADTAPDITLGCPAGAHINNLLDQIVQLLSTSGDAWYWDVDIWRTFRLKQRSATIAPWNIDGGSDLLAGKQPIKLGYTETHDKLATFSYAIGTNTLFAALDATILGNGVQTNFQLPQNIAQVPTITRNTIPPTVDVPQTVGVLGVETGKNWYWNQGSAAITQDASGTVLGIADSLLVKYRTTQPALAQFPNVGGLQERAATECTSGLWDNLIQVTQPIEPDALLKVAQTYAEQYGRPAQTCTISTLKPGLKTGQLQHITLPDIGVDDDFLIATVRMTTQMNVIQWDYTAFSGANVGNGVTGLVQFINRGEGTLSLLTPSVPITSAYTQSRPIVIDHTQVEGGADLTDFVVCFTGTYDFLATVANGGFVTNSNGYDIIFTNLLGNPLSFDLNYYNAVSGKVVFWVRVPTLSSSDDTTIFIKFGNSSVTTFQGDPANTWSPNLDVFNVPNANTHAAYHLTESTGPYVDSSHYANNSTAALTAYPTLTSGPFDAGQAMSSGHGIQLTGTVLSADGDVFHENSDATFSCWIKSSGQTAADGSAVANMWPLGGARGVSIGLKATTGKAYLLVVNWPLGSSEVDSTATVTDNAWHLIHGCVDHASGILYVDGVAQGSPTAGFAWDFVSGLYSTLGDYYPGAGFFLTSASLAEVRMAQTKRSAGWVGTEWNNQKAGSTFYAIGSGPSTVPVIVNPQGTVTHSAGALTANLPVIGNGGGDIKSGTRTGNTTEFVSATGTPATGKPLLYDASGNATPGALGQLVPSGGTTGQVLAKVSGTNYDTSWQAGGDSDVLINSVSTLNIIKVNATQVWAGQTDTLFNGV